MLFLVSIQPEILPRNNDPLLDDEDFDDVPLFFLFAPLSAALTGLIAQGGSQAVSYLLNSDVALLEWADSESLVETARVVGYVFAVACWCYVKRDT